jgi:hypothetical protein
MFDALKFGVRDFSVLRDFGKGVILGPDQTETNHCQYRHRDENDSDELIAFFSG